MEKMQEDQNVFDIRKIKLLFQNNYCIFLWKPIIFIKFGNLENLYHFF